MSISNIGYITQNHYTIIFVFYTLQNYITAYLVCFVIGIGQYSLQLRGGGLCDQNAVETRI
jgi:hypothetical protein